MLIVPDKKFLSTDHYLSPAENVAKLKQGNKELAAKKRMPKQDLLENQDMAVGQPMSPTLFIQKLRRLPNVIVEQGGIPNAAAVRTVVTDTDPTSETYGKEIKRYISGFYTDRILPEFSSILPDVNGLPTREIRGWRTVLLALFRSKVASYSQLKAAFGEPHGQRGILWQDQTRQAR
jgi:hypothetical protein